MTLAERVVALHEALEREGIPHAFGGALALAYHTLNPRSTNDIDLNIFLPEADPARALAALPVGVEQPRGTAGTIARDGQVRLWWEGTPVDLFFDDLPIHRAAAEHRRNVRFAGATIPVLGPDELTVFKVMFDRPRDWLDIAETIAAGTVDLGRVRAALREMLGPEDRRFARLEDAERAARDASED